MKLRHAITPTDNRPASPGPSTHAAVETQNGARAVAAPDAAILAELNRLAVAIADAAARSDIELNCSYSVDSAGVVWYDTEYLAPGCDPEMIHTARRYLQLRCAVRVHSIHSGTVAFPGVPE
ncbi:hypothetical protein [Lysobacter sp. CA196]|uniref:hypothetical protein n=1 Tax=Lysobacter sp. CA196 TaxID=3455606 RepID=UPI003F8D8A04